MEGDFRAVARVPQAAETALVEGEQGQGHRRKRGQKEGQTPGCPQGTAKIDSQQIERAESGQIETFVAKNYGQGRADTRHQQP